MMAAFTTAMDAKNGTGPYLKVQTSQVERGHGTFTLFLPMQSRGWPHVSFYSVEGGGDFGGSYFGTGDSVLKQWWGSKVTERKEKGKSSLSSVHEPATGVRRRTSTRAAKFPHVVQFEQAD